MNYWKRGMKRSELFILSIVLTYFKLCFHSNFVFLSQTDKTMLFHFYIFVYIIITSFLVIQQWFAWNNWITVMNSSPTLIVSFPYILLFNLHQDLLVDIHHKVINGKHKINMSISKDRHKIICSNGRTQRKAINNNLGSRPLIWDKAGKVLSSRCMLKISRLSVHILNLVAPSCTWGWVWCGWTKAGWHLGLPLIFVGTRVT